jgi:hypothetical protein
LGGAAPFPLCGVKSRLNGSRHLVNGGSVRHLLGFGKADDVFDGDDEVVFALFQVRGARADPRRAPVEIISNPTGCLSAKNRNRLKKGAGELLMFGELWY